MNYRSRYAHNAKNKQNKFLLEEHQASYQQLCNKLKDAKAIMDKMGVSPQVRPHDHQSLRFVNTYDERQMEIEDDLILAQNTNSVPKIINLGKIGGSKESTDQSNQIDSSSSPSAYQQMSGDHAEVKQYKFSQKVINQAKKLDEDDFDVWIEGIANKKWCLFFKFGKNYIER